MVKYGWISICGTALITFGGCSARTLENSKEEQWYFMGTMPDSYYRIALRPKLEDHGIRCDWGPSRFGWTVVSVSGTFLNAMNARDRILEFSSDPGWDMQWAADFDAVPNGVLTPEATGETSQLFMVHWVGIARIHYEDTPTRAVLNHLEERGLKWRVSLGDGSDVVLVKPQVARSAALWISSLDLPGVDILPLDP